MANKCTDSKVSTTNWSEYLKKGHLELKICQKLKNLYNKNLKWTWKLNNAKRK